MLLIVTGRIHQFLKHQLIIKNRVTTMVAVGLLCHISGHQFIDTTLTESMVLNAYWGFQ